MSEVNMVPRIFGRLIQFDERSREYPVTALLRQPFRRSCTWPCTLTLDQGAEGACAGFAVAHEAAAAPIAVPHVTADVALALYQRARALDEWPGEDYVGTSVLAAVKAGQERGWYRRYRWAFGELDLALAVGWLGPAVLGIPWYEDMAAPDAHGRVHATGTVIGGHAILCNGVSSDSDGSWWYLLHNSWGAGWGNYGECWISAEDMRKLLAEQGEACIPLWREFGD